MLKLPLLFYDSFSSDLCIQNYLLFSLINESELRFTEFTVAYLNIGHIIIAQVRVRDSGTPSMTSLADVIVNVIDVNDEPPRFTASVFRFVVVENQPAGTEVGYVAATDKDRPPFDHFRFVLMASGSSKATVNAFRIDRLSGRIATTRVLDREQRAEYHLICVAADPTVTALSAAVPVVISVGDVNDNSPAFSAGSDVIRVSYERAIVGHVVGRVEARDADDGPNGELFYWSESVDNDTVDLFTVDPRSGDITLVADVDEPAVGESVVYALSVTASDLGEPPRRTHVLLSIVVERQAHLGPGYRVDSTARVLVSWKWIALAIIVVVFLVVVVVLLVAICVAASGRRRRADDDDDGKTASGQSRKSRQSYNCRRRELEADEEAATRTALMVADHSETTVAVPVGGDVTVAPAALPLGFDAPRTDKTAPDADREVA